MAEKLAEIEISLTAESAVYRIDNCHADQSTPVHSLNSVHDVPLIVEKTLQDQQRCKKNIIVTGLPESQLTSDRDQFLALCESHLTTKPLVGESDCWRLRKIDSTRTSPRRLLVRLRSEDTASDLLRSARMLRQSSDNYVASNIYFNSDLTPAQAKLAYQLRVKRRENKARLRSDVKDNDSNGQPNAVEKSACVTVNPTRDRPYCFMPLSTSYSPSGTDCDHQPGNGGSMEKMASSVVDNTVDNTGCTNSTVNCTSIGGDCTDNPTDRSSLPFPQRQA